MTDSLPTKGGQYPSLDEFTALMGRFQAGDTVAETEIVQRMKTDKHWGEIVAECAGTMRVQWLKHANATGFTHEVLTARARSLQRDLVGDDPTVLESLLAERIVICTIALEVAESQYLGVMQGGASFKKVAFYEHIMDRAHRRYLSAIKALAQVRRLQLPAVSQVNVATNQVNVTQFAEGV